MKNATKYITKKFEKQIMDKKKTIYPHLTCAKGNAKPKVNARRLELPRYPARWAATWVADICAVP